MQLYYFVGNLRNGIPLFFCDCRRGIAFGHDPKYGPSIAAIDNLEDIA
jgi:hypothetical protein